MLNKVYQLVSPRQIEIVYKEIDLDENCVVVHPTHLSICHADQRYYQGLRSKEALSKKLPMALIHEAIGRVVYDPTGTFKLNERVVLIPNTPLDNDDVIAENYLRNSKFRASGYDGFLQEFVGMAPDRLVPVPETINQYVAAFTELVSVSYHAIDRFKKIGHKRREKIGVWGCGNLGYITSLLLKHLLPESKIYVFGVNDHKLKDFTFVDETYTIQEIPEGLNVDHAFECVGGAGSASAINQIIDYINPEGTISLLGVSEEPVAINTRMVLEKGLRLFGSSRSGREDFCGLIKLYQDNDRLVNNLEKLIGANMEIRHTADIVNAFEMDIHKMMGKTIMIWGK